MATKEPIKPRPLSVKEAASYLGRSVPSLRELIWTGSWPIVRVGRRIHLDIFDLGKVYLNGITPVNEDDLKKASQRVEEYHQEMIILKNGHNLGTVKAQQGLESQPVIH